MRDVISGTVIPVFLGNTKYARMLARRFFWRFGVISYIFDRADAKGVKFMVSAVSRPLPITENDEFDLLSLERFATDMGELTYLLIPCTKSFSSLVFRNRDKLEGRFIIRSRGEMLSAFHIKCAPRKKTKSPEKFNEVTR